MTASIHQETPNSGSSSRWESLRKTRKSATRNRSANEWLDVGIDVVASLGTYVLIVLGFTASYSTIRKIAVEKGNFSDTMSHIVPLSFEGGIIILSLRVIREARAGRRALFLRLIVAMGALATLVTNFRAESQGIEGQLTHVVPVAMFIICFEWMIHSARKKALQDMGLLPPPMPNLRPVEWLLDFSNSFARWRLMALHNIPNPEYAMWVRQKMLIRRAELINSKGVKGSGWFSRKHGWKSVPSHLRLQMVEQVLAEAEERFGPAQGSPNSALHQPEIRVELGSNEEKKEEPKKTVRPVSQVPPQRELNSEPTLIETFRPTGAEIVGVEKQVERAEREEMADNQRRQLAYEKAVEVVQEFMDLGHPISGTDIAKDSRIPVGTRSVQRYLNRMVTEGLIPEEAISK